jgi:heme/copper-type cytochrome/quinol oxidase subunit 2
MAVAHSYLRFGLVLAAVGIPALAQLPAQETAGQRSFTVVARKYAFEPGRLEANADDLVRISLSSRDIAHSFTIDEYRIAKRVGGGQTVTFEFRADQPGTFRVYCNLKQDERCREMHGVLVVHPRK